MLPSLAQLRLTSAASVAPASEPTGVVLRPSRGDSKPPGAELYLPPELEAEILKQLKGEPAEVCREVATWLRARGAGVGDRSKPLPEFYEALCTKLGWDLDSGLQAAGGSWELWFKRMCYYVTRPDSPVKSSENLERYAFWYADIQRKILNAGKGPRQKFAPWAEMVPRELWGDRVFVLKVAAITHGLVLKYALGELRNDKEVVLAAVTVYGHSLRYASDELKNDKEVVLAAVAQDGDALEYASDELQNDEEVVLAAGIR